MAKVNSVAVIGNGFVGGSLTTVFTERGSQVYVYDIAGKVAPGGLSSCMLQNGKISSLETFIEKFEERNSQFSQYVYFVCLPTPMMESGECDVSLVEETLSRIAAAPRKDLCEKFPRIAVVKSTIPPGTTARWNAMFEKLDLHVVFNPEFLTEANALNDMRNQDRIVIGGPRPYINTIKQLFESMFPDVPLIKTSSTTAEMVKYVTNIFLATKVSLANEFYQICTALNTSGTEIDYDKVIEYATFDKRLGTSHWKVPGPMPDDITGKPALGWGGSCFIKDLHALVFLSRQLGVDPKVMMGAWNKNLEVRPQRDWEKLEGRAVSKKKS